MPDRKDGTRPPAAAAPYPAPHQVPATGVDAEEATSIKELPTPDLRGTIMFTVILLMAIFGFWVLMFIELLNR
jgi:hypothetical protein